MTRPSPVPAGTGRACIEAAIRAHEWLETSSSGHSRCRCNPEVWVDDYPAHVADAFVASLAAVVSSSPATPPEKEKRACVRCLHGWYGHDRGSGPCLHEDCSCEGFTLRATSPATPEGGRVVIHYATEWANLQAPYCDPANYDWPSVHDQSRVTCPECIEAAGLVVGASEAAPSPASPAETRGGRAWEEGFAAGAKWGPIDDEWYDDSQSFNADDLPPRPPKPSNPYTAASPADP